MALASFEINPNAAATGEEVRDLLVGLADDVRTVVITRPDVGEFKILSVNGRDLGNQNSRRLEIEYDDVPIA